MKHRCALVLALFASAGCAAAWNDRYVHRIGLLAGEKALLERYRDALAAGDFQDLIELFDHAPESQRAAALAIVELRRHLAPILVEGGSIDQVDAEVRDFELFAQPPVAQLWFAVGGRDANGARHHFRLKSTSTFRELGRLPPDREGLAIAQMVLLHQDPFAVEHQVGMRPHFEDATERAGLVDRHRNQSIDKKCLILQGTMPGSGGAAADFDGDGDVDLVAIDGQHSLLYVNRGDGTFDDRSQEWGLAAFSGAGAVAADYDGDGDEDLYVLDHFGGTRLLRNDVDASGARRFTDVTAEAGVGVEDPTFSATFVDIDRDGDLDLFVPVAGDYYSQVPMPPFHARDGRKDRLFVNDGTGRFTEEGEARGVAEIGWGLCAGACDYDGDGDDDLYVANDFGLNALFRNDGTGHFEDVAWGSGASDRGYGMGVSWGDVDADGDFDLYVSNIYSEYAPVFLDPDYPLPPIGRFFRGWVGRELHRMGTGNTLLLNRGDGTFEDVAKTWRVNECGWAWGGMFLDHDSDGDLDIYCPNGSYTGAAEGDLELTFWAMSSLMWEQSKMQQWLFDAEGRSLQGHERNRLFEQRGPGDFAEVGFLHGVDAIQTGRGLVLADFDDDGYVDFYLRNLNDEARLYRNSGGTNHWLRLRLEGTHSNRGAIGAVAKATVAGAVRVRQVTAGDGFYASHDKRLLFGLGEATSADVEIRWPSGMVETFPGLAADRTYHVREGSGVAVPLEPRRAPAVSG